MGKPSFHRIALLAVALAMAPAEGVRASVECGAPAAVPALEATRDWVDTDIPLLVFESGLGTVQVRRFDGTVLRSFRPPGGEGPFQHYPSADGRWVAIKVASGQQGLQEDVWLVDIHTGEMRRVFHAQRYTLGLPEFSPDGRWLALSVSSDSRAPADNPVGLWLVDTATGERRQLPIPEGLMADHQPFISPDWQADGSALLVKLTKGMEFHRHLRFAPVPAGRFTTIRGDRVGSRTRFLGPDGEIPLARGSHPRSRQGAWDLRSDNGTWRAWVDDAHALYVEGPSGGRHRLAQGTYEQCEGITIGVTGWVGDRFLVYDLAGTAYIAEVATGRQAELLPGAEGRQDFHW